MDESFQIEHKDDTDGKRETYLERWQRRMTSTYEEGSCEDCCSVLRHSLAEMLTGVTWQLGIVTLVLIEVIISAVLMLIEFNAIKDETHLARIILHFLSITILAVFVLEVCLKFYAMGCDYFLEEKLEIFDAFVVITAFGIEIMLSVMRAKKVWSGFAFLIALRLWRVVRLVFLLFTFKEEIYELIEDEEDAPKQEETERAENENVMEKNEEKQKITVNE